MNSKRATTDDAGGLGIQRRFNGMIKYRAEAQGEHDMKYNQPVVFQEYAHDNSENKIKAKNPFHHGNPVDPGTDVTVPFPGFLQVGHIEFGCPHKRGPAPE